jgi:hypothetical protein
MTVAQSVAASMTKFAAAVPPCRDCSESGSQAIDGNGARERPAFREKLPPEMRQAPSDSYSEGTFAAALP